MNSKITVPLVVAMSLGFGAVAFAQGSSAEMPTEQQLEAIYPQHGQPSKSEPAPGLEMQQKGGTPDSGVSGHAAGRGTTGSAPREDDKPRRLPDSMSPKDTRKIDPYYD